MHAKWELRKRTEIENVKWILWRRRRQRQRLQRREHGSHRLRGGRHSTTPEKWGAPERGWGSGSLRQPQGLQAGQEQEVPALHTRTRQGHLQRAEVQSHETEPGQKQQWQTGWEGRRSHGDVLTRFKHRECIVREFSNFFQINRVSEIYSNSQV